MNPLTTVTNPQDIPITGIVKYFTKQGHNVADEKKKKLSQLWNNPQKQNQKQIF